MNLCGAANRAWRLTQRRSAVRFETAIEEPAQVQQAILKHTLSRNRGTAFGQRHHFGRINTIEDYCERVPLCTYVDLVDDINRIRRGEPNILTHDAVTHLIPTSGSTGGMKLIPYTKSLQAQFNRAIAPWVVGLFDRDPSLLDGPAYWSISPAFGFPCCAGDRVPIGFDDDAAYLGRLGRRLVTTTMAVPSAVRMLHDIGDFRHATLFHLLAARDLRLVSVWHPSFWQLLVDTLPQRWEHLCRDLARGSCSLPSGRPWPLRVPPRDVSHCDPRDTRGLWPALRLISAWGDGAAAKPYASMQGRWPHVRMEPKGVISTEAFVSLPWRSTHVAAVQSHVIEWLDDDGRCVSLHEAEIGGCYEPVVTTAGGLYRYRTGDRVEITGRAKKTPTLRLVGRNDQVHDLCGEKLSEVHVASAIDDTLARFNLQATFTMLAPADAHAPTHYELFIAVDAPLSEVTRAEVQEMLDRVLCANPHYAYARQLEQLGMPAVVEVAGDAHERYLTRMQHSTRQLGGVKPAVISKHPGWRDTFRLQAR